MYCLNTRWTVSIKLITCNFTSATKIQFKVQKILLQFPEVDESHQSTVWLLDVLWSKIWDRHLRCITANQCLNICERVEVVVRYKEFDVSKCILPLQMILKTLYPLLKKKKGGGGVVQSMFGLTGKCICCL